MKNRMKHLFCAAIMGAFLMIALPVIAYATNTSPIPPNGFGAPQSLTYPATINDYHTDSSERFSYNYYFTSGVDYRYDLGRSTTFTGSVPVDMFNANIRRDRHVAFVPPNYGRFSGYIPTFPRSDFFPQPVHPSFWQSFELENPNALSIYDTLRMGANAPTLGNPMNMHHVGQQGVLPPTSSDMPPGGWIPAQPLPGEGGFLPPTSIE